MNVRLLADENFDRRIVRGLRKRIPALQFLVPDGIIPKGTSDPEVLQLAKNVGCILVSHDRETMPGHFYTFLANRSSPGLILIRQNYPVRPAVDDLELLCACCSSEEFTNRIVYIPDR